MAVLQSPRKIERNDGVMYFHFNDNAIAKTKSYARGEVNVDLDASGMLVGVEVLSFGEDEIAALSSLAQEHHLDIATIFREISPQAVGLCHN